MFLINLKYITATWLFKVAKFMWVKIYSIPVCINFCLIASVYTHMGSEGPPTARYCNFHHLRGNESWQVMSKFVHFTSVHFPDLNQNSCNNLNNVKSDLRIHWGLIFTNDIRCSRLQRWVGYFIYFKFTCVYFNGYSLVQSKK